VLVRDLAAKLKYIPLNATGLFAKYCIGKAGEADVIALELLSIWKTVALVISI